MGARAVGFATVVAAVLAVPATTAGAARPPDLVCGQVITTDVVLHTDLSCAGDGLVVGASGITVRLAGHTITSTDGAGMGIRFGRPEAAGPSECVTGTRVLGGTISGFFAGVGSETCHPTVRNEASNLRLTGNTWGAYVPDGHTLALDRTAINGPNGLGGPFSRGTPSGTFEVTRSTITTTSPDGFAVFDAFSPTSTFDATWMSGGRIYGIVNGNIQIERSLLVDVRVDCADAEIMISDSILVRSPVVRTGTCGHALERNWFVGPGSGVAVITSNGFPLTATGNTFTGWDTAIEVGTYATATVTGNTFHHNGTAISCVIGPCRGTISANTIRDNTGTGILLSTGTWHVGSNVLLRNGGLGIDAQGTGLTIVDDGGNIARGNAPPQCIGVVCTRR